MKQGIGEVNDNGKSHEARQNKITHKNSSSFATFTHTFSRARQNGGDQFAMTTGGMTPKKNFMRKGRC